MRHEESGLGTGRNVVSTVRTFARRTVDVVLAAMLLLVVTTSIDAEAAHAHETVTSSNPAAGSVLATIPRTVVVQFVGKVSRAAVTLTDSCGQEVPGRVTVSGSRASAALLVGGSAAGTWAGGGRDAAPSRWVVRWQAVGSDGHVVSGQIPFTVMSTRCLATTMPSEPPTVTRDQGQAASTAADAPVSRNLPMLPVGAAMLTVLAFLAVALTRRHPGQRRA